jgi:hypothetical protein
MRQVLSRYALLVPLVLLVLLLGSGRDGAAQNRPGRRDY